jgi:hypothetical protein
MQDITAVKESFVCSGRMTGYTEITRLVARHKMFFGSSKSVRCGSPTTQELGVSALV